MFVCVQMAVCMTAALTGMNDNGHSNHSPLEKWREKLLVCEGRGLGYWGPNIQFLPPKLATVVPATKARLYINHTHTQTDETELALSHFEMHIMAAETKEE